MKITIEAIPVSNIAKFAKQYGFELQVNERKRAIGAPDRYYAYFNRAKIKNGGILSSEYGNGSTPEEAIDNYARRIEMKTLVVNAYSDTERKEIEVPRLFKKKS